MTKLEKVLLLLIITLALGLRLYRLDSVPPSISWDEAAVGYNAWTIANYARDEYGKFLPIYFRSFGEDKQPIHIYITAIFVKLFGLSEFSIRLPAAFFGTLNVLLIFFLTRILFKSNLVGLFSSFFLAISPQNIHFSRFNHEANFALFFFMLGLLLFYQVVKKRNKLLPFSFLCFILSMISYHAAEIAVPPIVLVLVILYFNKLWSNKIYLFVALFLVIVFAIFSFLNPRVLGIARYNQTVQGRSDLEKTEIFKWTKNLQLARINLALTQYLWHFDPKFLFVSGDKNPRLSSQGTGEFYKIDGLFLILGIIYLIYKRSKEGIIVLGWVAIGPLPSSLFAEAPHAGRAMFMMGSWHLISALGLYSLINIFPKSLFKWTILSISFTILIISLLNYLNYYYNEYSKRYAIEWQYGMKDIVNFIKDHPEYSQVYMTDVRHQPYIFFLYYLETPLVDYLSTVTYNRENSSKSYNLVFFYNKYFFGGWDPIESMPNTGVLYVVSPSEYDGLRHKLEFDVKKIVYYPNGTSAFYLISKD